MTTTENPPMIVVDEIESAAVSTADAWSEQLARRVELHLRSGDFALAHRVIDAAEVESLERSLVKPATTAEVLDQPLSDLDLPQRIVNHLEAERFTTVGDLAGVSRERLLRIDGFAERTVAAIALAVGRVVAAAVDDD